MRHTKQNKKKKKKVQTQVIQASLLPTQPNHSRTSNRSSSPGVVQGQICRANLSVSKTLAGQAYLSADFQHNSSHGNPVKSCLLAKINNNKGYLLMHPVSTSTFTEHLPQPLADMYSMFPRSYWNQPHKLVIYVYTCVFCKYIHLIPGITLVRCL